MGVLGDGITVAITRDYFKLPLLVLLSNYTLYRVAAVSFYDNPYNA